MMFDDAFEFGDGIAAKVTGTEIWCNQFNSPDRGLHGYNVRPIDKINLIVRSSDIAGPDRIHAARVL